MNLRLLRYFLAVVDAGSVTAASRVLYVAQPSLSRQLRRLEADLGLGLFDRSDGRLRLTAAGRAFLPVARDLVSRAEVARATAQSLAQGADVRLTLAGHPTTVADVIAPFIVAAGADGVVTNVVETSAYSVYSAVERGTPTWPSARGSRRPICSTRWSDAPSCGPSARPSTRWPRATGCSLEDLVEWPLIVMHDDHGVRRMFDEAITREGLAYRAAHVARTPNVAQALAAAGRGVCIVSDDARFGLRELPIVVGGSELSITLFGAWDPTHYAAETIQNCVAQLSTFTQDLYEARTGHPTRPTTLTRDVRPSDQGVGAPYRCTTNPPSRRANDLQGRGRGVPGVPDRVEPDAEETVTEVDGQRLQTEPRIIRCHGDATSRGRERLGDRPVCRLDHRRVRRPRLRDGGLEGLARRERAPAGRSTAPRAAPPARPVDELAQRMPRGHIGPHRQHGQPRERYGAWGRTVPIARSAPRSSVSTGDSPSAPRTSTVGSSGSRVAMKGDTTSVSVTVGAPMVSRSIRPCAWNVAATRSASARASRSRASGSRACPVREAVRRPPERSNSSTPRSSSS